MEEIAAKKLLKAGFAKFEYEKEVKAMKSSEISQLDDGLAEKYADQENTEIEKGVNGTTDFPSPIVRHRFIREKMNISMEETYYWIMSQLKQSLAFPYIIKVKDLFAASEQSSMFGNSQQRLALQQDKASQYLAIIGKMVKELFQLVRELRILDERLKYYSESKRGDKSAEITLKGIWIDLVEGGSKNPASVYGMAHEVGFTTLPDLFFEITPKKSEDVDRVVESTEFNKKVKEVLKRKLKTYLLWKENTQGELNTKRKFTLRYMRQHYDAIKMYMEWVKPYLAQIKRLMFDERKLNDPNLVSAFEGSLIDVEFIAYKKESKFGRYLPCVIATFNYRTTPSLNYHAEGYQRGPIHVGKVECTLRGYIWTKEQIEAYKKYRNDEVFEVLGSIDNSLKEAMDALGDSMKEYLEESGEIFEKQEKPEKKEKEDSIIEPFLSIFRGFGEIISSFAGSPGEKSEKKVNKFEDDAQKSKAAEIVFNSLWTTYQNYKKAHSLMAW
ncbi:MAG: hypothetical protein NTV63_02365 [Candidatus Woesearchaeota archaeon]|nr:hypothetical protein [Candidatus Woesearchaeota archaeon]